MKKILVSEKGFFVEANDLEKRIEDRKKNIKTTYTNKEIMEMLLDIVELIKEGKNK